MKRSEKWFSGGAGSWKGTMKQGKVKEKGRKD